MNQTLSNKAYKIIKNNLRAVQSKKSLVRFRTVLLSPFVLGTV